MKLPMMLPTFIALILSFPTFQNRARAVSVDLSQARLVEQTADTVRFSHVKFADLQQPVWATFKWDSESNALKLGSIGGTPHHSDLPIGEWSLSFTWGTCDVNGNNYANTTPFIMNEDHTFRVQSYVGKWTFDPKSNRYSHTIDASSGALYTGTYDGKGGIRGTMEVQSYKGCFRLTYSHAAQKNDFDMPDSAGNF